MKSTTCLLRILIALSFLNLFSLQSIAYSNKLNHAIDSVDMAIQNINNIISMRYQSIDSLRGYGNRSSAELDILTAREYEGLNNDSSIVYYTSAIHKAGSDTAVANRAKIYMARRMAVATMFNEAADLLDSIKPEELSNYDKLQYFKSLATINLEYYRYSNIDKIKEKSRNNAINALDSILAILPEKDNYHKIARAQHGVLTGNETIATGDLLEIIDSSNTEDKAYYDAVSMLAELYGGNEKTREEYMYYLALAAKSNLTRGNLENAPLLHLGKQLFENGDLNRAYTYMHQAGANIYNSNSRNLYTQLVPTMANMIEANRDHEAKMNSIHIFTYIFALVIIIILGTLLWKRHNALIRKNIENKLLSDSLHAGEDYTNRILDLCSYYIESMEEFNRLVDRKIKTNQIKDLHQMIESGKALKSMNESFFEVFDNAALNIYPDYISQLNTLLLPDKQFSEPEAGKLCPELRIAFFMRMGVTDSTRLSKFLGLSLNTIYTYRNRLKSRAINRENFEDSIINLR